MAVTLLLLATLLVSAPSARALAPFSVSIERPERTLDTGAFTTFEVHVVNEGDDTIAVRAIRVLNDLPDTAWYASICSINICYPPEIDTTELEDAAPGAMTGFTIHVITGSRYGDTARIGLLIESESGADTAVRVVTIVTAPPPVQLIRIEPNALELNVTAGQIAEFIIWTYNQAGDTIGVTARRIEEYYTADWDSQICVEEDCLVSSADSTGEVVLDNDKATYFKLRVRTRGPGQGRIVLRFISSRGDEIEKRFTVNAGVAAAPGETVITRPAYPNPARTHVRVPLPKGVTSFESMSVVLVRLDGRRPTALAPTRIDGTSMMLGGTSIALDGTSMVLDVSTLPAGSYGYRIATRADTITGRFHVVR